jgi:hypothetical protein
MLIEGTFRVTPEDNANGQQAAAGTFRFEVNLVGDPQAPPQPGTAPLPAPAEDVHEPAPEQPADVNFYSLLSFNSQKHSYIPVQPPPWQPVNLAGNPQAPPQPGAAPLPAPAQNIPFAPDDPVSSLFINLSLGSPIHSLISFQIPQPRVFIPPIIFIRRRRRRL